MARRTYRYDPVTKEMVEVGVSRSIKHGLFEDNFVSPVDGSVITSQRKLQDHCIKHNIQQITPDVEAGWKEREKERQDHYTKQVGNRHDRIEALKHAFDVHTRRRR